MRWLNLPPVTEPVNRWTWSRRMRCGLRRRGKMGKGAMFSLRSMSAVRWEAPLRCGSSSHDLVFIMHLIQNSLKCFALIFLVVTSLHCLNERIQFFVRVLYIRVTPKPLTTFKKGGSVTFYTGPLGLSAPPPSAFRESSLSSSTRPEGVFCSAQGD